MLDIKELDFIFPKMGGKGEDSILSLNPQMLEYETHDFETNSTQPVFKFREMEREAWFVVLVFWLKSPYLKIFDLTERIIECAHICGFIREKEMNELLSPENRNINFKNINMRRMALRFLNFQKNFPFATMSALQLAFHFNNIQLITPPFADETPNETNKRIVLQKHTIDTVIPALEELQLKINARQLKIEKEQEKLKEHMSTINHETKEEPKTMSGEWIEPAATSPEEGGFIIE